MRPWGTVYIPTFLSRTLACCIRHQGLPSLESSQSSSTQMPQLEPPCYSFFFFFHQPRAKLLSHERLQNCLHFAEFFLSPFHENVWQSSILRSPLGTTVPGGCQHRPKEDLCIKKYIYKNHNSVIQQRNMPKRSEKVLFLYLWPASVSHMQESLHLTDIDGIWRTVFHIAWIIIFFLSKKGMECTAVFNKSFLSYVCS